MPPSSSDGGPGQNGQFSTLQQGFACTIAEGPHKWLTDSTILLSSQPWPLPSQTGLLTLLHRPVSVAVRRPSFCSFHSFCDVRKVDDGQEGRMEKGCRLRSPRDILDWIRSDRSHAANHLAHRVLDASGGSVRERRYDACAKVKSSRQTSPNVSYLFRRYVQVIGGPLYSLEIPKQLLFAASTTSQHVFVTGRLGGEHASYIA